MSEELYYQFVSANKRLHFDTDSSVDVELGQTLHFDGKPILCQRGFHASKRPLDALYHAPSDAEWLCGVRLSGTVIHGTGASVATECTVITMLNTRKLLVEFALWNAEQAFEAIRKIGIEPDERSIQAVRVVRLWLADEASKEELIAAADAAYTAADAAYTADAAYADAAYADAQAADAAARAIDAAAHAADAADAAARASYAAARASYAAARASYAAARASYAAARAAQNGQLEKMIRISKGA